MPYDIPIDSAPAHDATQAAIADIDSRVSTLEQLPMLVDGMRMGPLTLPAAASFTSLPPSPFQIPLNVLKNATALVTLSAYISTSANNDEIVLALAWTGDYEQTPDQYPPRWLRTGGKDATLVTVSLSFLMTLYAGDTTVEVQYTAQVDGGQVSNLELTIAQLGYGMPL